MPISFIEYNLQNSFIHNWLTAGPQKTPFQNQVFAKGGYTESKIIQNLYSSKSGITKMPVERGPMTEGLFKIGDYEGSWSYLRCLDDHSVDHSTTTAVCCHLRSWAYTQLVSPQAGQASFWLWTCGPVDVWLNHKRIFHDQQLFMRPMRHAFKANLKESQNEILVRFEAIAAPQARLFFALKVADCAGIRVRIPSLIQSLERRNELEAVYQALYLDRDVYAAGDTIYMRWPDKLEKASFNSVDFKNEAGLIYSHADDVGKPNDTVFLGNSISLTGGNYRAVVMPLGWEYYESHIRITQEISAYVIGNIHFLENPYGTPGERKMEALIYAAKANNDLFAEIAKMALQWWEQVEVKVIQHAIKKVEERQLDSQLIALGLLGMLNRYSADQHFPQWLKKLLKDCLLNYRYAAEDPGFDGMDFSTESQQIISAACQILSGQAYPNQIFSNCGLTGVRLRKRGEQRALAWMQSHSQRGFNAWDSPEIYADSLTALSYLVDFARSEPVWGLASVVMDKLLYSIATNSYQGAYGSSRGKAQSQSVKSCLLDATSGITRVLFGMGIFNSHLSSTVSLALMSKYELPEIITDIAARLPTEYWGREQTGLDQPVNKVTYRTPYGMLSSAQDYRPGQLGEQQHIWQATLAPDCVVFSNHPGCANEKEERAPNFWRGNGILPRVAQWKDALIAVYNLAVAENRDDFMGFTHAYFLVASFDEVAHRDNWFFGRKGDSYIGLTASMPIEEIQSGRTAKRELRAQGSQTIWLCQLGNSSQDESFTKFQDQVASALCQFEELKVEWKTTRGEKLRFGWEGPFLRDNENLPLSGFKHFENPYCTADFPCEQLEIHSDGDQLRLDFKDE